MSCVDNINSTPAKAATYAGYILGGSFFVGAYRTAIAVYYKAMHFFNAETYRQTYSVAKKEHEEKSEKMHREYLEKTRGRSKDNFQAKMETYDAKSQYQKASGIDKLKAGVNLVKTQVGEKATNLKNAVGSAKDSVVQDIKETMAEIEEEVTLAPLAAFEKIEDAKNGAWSGQLVRGLVEMIPVVGGIIYTGYDMTHKKVSVLGLSELNMAQKLDDLVDFSPKQLYQYF